MNDHLRQQLAAQYEGDACGYYAALGRLIMQGKLKEPLTDEMREALMIENRRVVGMTDNF